MTSNESFQQSSAAPSEFDVGADAARPRYRISNRNVKFR
jgi:hypothetical protein